MRPPTAGVALLLVGALACGEAPVSVDTTPDIAPAPARGGTLTASIRADPQTFNRLIARDNVSGLISELIHASLVRIDRGTDTLEPWLAESWTLADDGLTYTLRLRQGVSFSDGQPFTAEDVVFTFDALYDERLASPLADSIRIQGQPLAVSTSDASTVVIRFPVRYGPGLRVLDSLPMLPKHRLAQAHAAGELQSAWGLSTAPQDLVGLGPFVFQQYQPGERVIFARNDRYWRRDDDGAALPYLDGVTLEVVTDQNAEILALDTGRIDVTQSEIRPEDFQLVTRAVEAGRAHLYDLGAGLDADFLFVNLKPDAFSGDPREDWVQRDELRRAISHAVDRLEFAETVYAGLAEPVFGPVTPGNRRWFSAATPQPGFDPTRARALLEELGLRDADGDGRLEGPRGEVAGFTLLTQRGNTLRERAAAVIQEDLRRVGLSVEVVALEFGALIERVTTMDFEAAYLGFRASDTDPAANLDFWLSSAGFHVWNPSQESPATEWEGRIDELMSQQLVAADDSERTRIFAEVQRLFAEHQPAIYFAAPRVVIATSARVVNVAPAILQPQVLWNADSLAVAP